MCTKNTLQMASIKLEFTLYASHDLVVNTNMYVSMLGTIRPMVSNLCLDTETSETQAEGNSDFLIHNQSLILKADFSFTRPNLVKFSALLNTLCPSLLSTSR